MKQQFGYKAWANGEIIQALSRIDSGAHADTRRAAIRVLNHTYVVDRIFAAHLAGASHEYSATNTDETPELADLAAWIAESDRWYLDYVDSVLPSQLDERLAFRFTDGEAGAMTRAEMLFHVLTHGVYHRGNIGMLLSACGVSRPKDTFARYLHAVQPQRRVGT